MHRRELKESGGKTINQNQNQNQDKTKTYKQTNKNKTKNKNAKKQKTNSWTWEGENTVITQPLQSGKHHHRAQCWCPMPASEQGSSEQAPDGLQPLYRGSGGPLGSSFPRPGGSCPCGSFLLGITLLPQGWPVLLPTERWSVVSQFCWPSLPMGCISAACSTTGCFTMPLQQIFVVVSPSACASLSEQTEGYSRGIFT